MPRYKLVIEYDGTPFAGWQRQANALSVQQVVEEAIRRFAGEDVRIQCAGRTDAGVHATGQVAHMDLSRTWRTDTIRDALNAHLKPRPVAILWAEEVPDRFNARMSAVKRHYRYRILNRRAPPAIERNAVWHVPWPLDAGRMEEAAQVLVGRHDFTTFRASECQAASPVRTLDRFDVRREGDLITVEASARSFLHSQVRSMVGTIVQAGNGRWSVEDVRRALDARRRSACAPLAPPQGLALIGVDYPDELPDRRAEHAVDHDLQGQSEQGDRARQG
ncbi:tRNA pseudouridine(38-40) synthase TruA [Enterovirga sp. DB1703]|uniref:tRNA pseudouridine synthase A n=1 Tax=Enterovirga aerilata TaxID=2730920 RepID=A0A849IJ39_9HYPH|nr:tRNA pseudouridine(38-40) synthase TruA [Enterovirga sp. DB1703]